MRTDTIYKSKIGPEVLIPVVLVLGAVTAYMAINSVWLGGIFCLVAWFLLFDIYTKTYYEITSDNRLIIQSWNIESWNIEVEDIISVTKKSNLLLSSTLDRLQINYKGGHVTISPANKERFIDILRKINSKIEEG